MGVYFLMNDNTQSLPVDLTSRLQPQQRRAQRSVELILSTAAELLDEVGLDSFNTNLLAERADIRVRTVYRYFPNKFAVLAELARRNTAHAIEAVDEFSTLADPKVPLQYGLEKLWANYLDKLAVVPGMTAVRHACRVCPELESIRDEFHSKLSKQMVAAMKQRGVQLKPPQLRNIAALFVETTSAILDYTATVGQKRRLDLLRELQVMQFRYLAPYLS